MNGKELVETLQRILDVKDPKQLSQSLGVTQVTVYNWQRCAKVTPRMVAQVIKKTRSASQRESLSKTIRPIVEFFPITKTPSKQNAKYELFSTKTPKNTLHSYLQGLRKELDQHHGVYIFYDSRGEAIYAGKARKQTLWKEITNAFNRDRGSIQKIKRVQHPKRQVSYRTSLEKTRQIVDREVPLHELAKYFSAYEVSDPMIAKVESLLVRGFANDLLNQRMEKFGHQRDSGTR